DGDGASRQRVVELVDEHGPALAQLLDHVLVVDDLLADVDGRSVELERPLHRLDRAIDAGAVTPRRREQQLLDGHAASVGPHGGADGDWQLRAQAGCSFATPPAVLPPGGLSRLPARSIAIVKKLYRRPGAVGTRRLVAVVREIRLGCPPSTDRQT